MKRINETIIDQLKWQIEVTCRVRITGQAAMAKVSEQVEYLVGDLIEDQVLDHVWGQVCDQIWY